MNDDGDRQEYVRALDRAIVAWTRAELERNPLAFRYGGADFTGALHRLAHFRFVRCEPLYAAYRRCLQHDIASKGPVPLDFSWLAEVVRHLVQPPCTTKRQARRYISELSTRLIPAIEAYRRWRGRTPLALRKQATHRRPQVLLYAVSPKKWRYLLPICTALNEAGTSAAFGTALGLRARFYRDTDTPYAVGGLARRRRVRNAHVAVTQLGVDYDRIYGELHALGPDVVLVAEGCHAADSLVQEAARELGIRSVCLQQGWAPVPHVGFTDMHFDSFIVWGEGFAEQLRPLNPRQHFNVLGNHILPAGEARENAWEALDTPRREAIAVALQPDVNAIPGGTCRAMIEMVARLAHTHPSQRFHVREHPNQPLEPADRALLEGIANVEWKNPGEVALDEFLKGAALVVAGSSTTLLEGMSLGAVPVVVNVRAGQRYNPDLDAAGAGIQAEGTAEAEHVITRLILDDEWRRSFREPMRRFATHYFRQDGEPLARIVEHLSSLRQSSDDSRS